jgi:hypothetical protein
MKEYEGNFPGSNRRCSSIMRSFAAIILVSVVCVSILSGQDRKPANPAAELPNIVLLVHQEIQPGKASVRQKLDVAMKRTCDRLDVPSSWIGLQSLTGPREVLFLDPFDSFEHLEQSFVSWAELYALHPDLPRMHEEIDALVTSERTIVAVLRDDLGYRADSIDLSETRFMRVFEVRLLPGHESDFVEALRVLDKAYEKINSDTPWAVYQVNLGIPSPAFLIFMPMSALKQNDDLLARKEALLEAEGEEAAQRLQQTAREAYASTESNLYAVRPEISHVSKGFAAGDPDFWIPKMEAHEKPRR